MRKNEDLKAFAGQYPYGSELFGIYQTLLGWKGARAKAWFSSGYERERSELRSRLFRGVGGDFDARPNADGFITEIGEVRIGRPVANVSGRSRLVEALKRRLPDDIPQDNEDFWRAELSDDVLMGALNREVREEAERLLQQSYDEAPDGVHLGRWRQEQVHTYLEQESRLAGQIKLLRDSKALPELQTLLATPGKQSAALIGVADYLNKWSPEAYLDPTRTLSSVLLSPIGMIHLFRQYFFELDSFLGQPVGHVWVAPFTTVELVEINTRRKVTEHSFDQSTFTRTESFDESFSFENLHVAVTRANQEDLSFGASVSGNHSWIVGSVQATSSMNYHDSQTESRQTVHDLTRRRTQRAAAVMERSVKTTFKTVTDESEISSKKYVVSNQTPELLNYELRRKMRRVAVQLQDAGTYLSWQSFVDEPGRELGLANLLHIAEPPNLANIPHPEMIVPKEAEKKTTETVMIPFQPEGHTGCDPADEGDNEDQTYHSGIESSIGYADSPQSIKNSFPQRFRSPDPDYRLSAVHATSRADAEVTVRTPLPPPAADGYYEFTLYLDYVHFHGALSIPVELELIWESTEDRAKIDAENDKRLNSFVAAQKRAYEEAYVKAARERVNAASKVTIRPYEDLRQEERIAVYRRLVNSLAPGSPSASGGAKFSYVNMSDETRHAWSEVLNRLFDLEKMLYFVAPEWWRPRAHQALSMGSEVPVVGADGKVQLDAYGNVVTKSTPKTTVSQRFVTSWGGGAEAGRPNYYITEDSETVPLGSSLGWLLQLDGDSMRNAFLNAPWVKAIVPIRPGQERAAVAWLKEVAEGDDGLDAALEAEVLQLADAVAEKHLLANQVFEYPDTVDPDSSVSATPLDRVFEYGFDPLAGGFRAQSIDGGQFEIIDQWVEVVPTDQVAAAEVKYDPATGRQVPIV